MATLSMASGGKREREAGVGDAEMIGVQLHTAIRTTKPLHNYLAVPRDDSLTPKYRRLIVDWVAETSASMGLPNGTVHQAMASFDRFLMGRAMSCNTELLKRLAVACLHLTVKINGTAEELASFQSAVSGIVSRQKILMDEYHVAVGLSWAVQTETASSMLELIRCLDTDGSAFCEPAVADARAVIHETLRDTELLASRPEVLALAAAVASLEARGATSQPLRRIVASHGVKIADDAPLRARMMAFLAETSRDCATTPSVAEACASPRPSSAFSEATARSAASTPAGRASCGSMSPSSSSYA